MSEKNCIFILCNPEDSRNIGSCCRAMKTMKFNHLRIVGEKEWYDENQVHTLALDAFDVWQNALFFASLSEAVADCTIAAGTTRRTGKKRMKKLFLPQEFTELAARTEGAKIGIVFGNERTGLTDGELDCCTMGLTIPTNPDYGSLNLSHAVQVIAWELFKTDFPSNKKTEQVSIKRIKEVTESLAENLAAMGFFKVAGKTDMDRFWKNIFSRAAVSHNEINYIEKLFITINAVSKKNNSASQIKKT